MVSKRWSCVFVSWDVQLCPIVDSKPWEMNFWLLFMMTTFTWIYFSTALFAIFQPMYGLYKAVTEAESTPLEIRFWLRLFLNYCTIILLYLSILFIHNYLFVYLIIQYRSFHLLPISIYKARSQSSGTDTRYSTREDRIYIRFKGVNIP